MNKKQKKLHHPQKHHRKRRSSTPIPYYWPYLFFVFLVVMGVAAWVWYSGTFFSKPWVLGDSSIKSDPELTSVPSSTTPVDCVDPVGKHIQTTYQACADLNNAANNDNFSFTTLTQPLLLSMRQTDITTPPEGQAAPVPPLTVVRKRLFGILPITFVPSSGSLFDKILSVLSF